MSNGKSWPEENSSPVPLPPLPRPGLALGGQLKRDPEDFFVEELRPQPLSGDGEHWVVTVEKRGVTTEAVEQWLARACGVPRKGVGHAGLKDRQAVAIQSLSVHLPGRPTPPPVEEPPPGVRILALGRDRRKIRPGHLAGNRFVIRLRGCARREGVVAELAAWVARHGFPNYFGPQRFGRRGENLAQGVALLQGRRGRGSDGGVVLSAVRSHLFNQVLARRIVAGAFTTLLDGDVAQLAGRTAAFPVVAAHAEEERFARGEIHPTGPLYGRNLLGATGIPGSWEEAVAREFAEPVRLLAGHGLDGGRRAIRVIPADLTWQWEERDLVVGFRLPPGGYATELLRLFQEG